MHGHDHHNTTMLSIIHNMSTTISAPPTTGSNYNSAIPAGFPVKPKTPHWYLQQEWRSLRNHRRNM